MGQVFTPADIVEFMLDNIGYTVQEEILTKTIYEPSFGQGVFLFAIVDRLMEKAVAENLSPVEITSLLDMNIHGVEYDEALYI
jgi:type I restriction-modification system DNA methylase subunit